MALPILELDPNFAPAVLELCRLCLAQTNYAAGLERSARALASLDLSERQRAELEFVRAQLLHESGLSKEALIACDQALQYPRAPVDWHLVRSRLQRQLGFDDRRREDLQRAWEQSGSVVLKIEWIEALIDGREWDQALRQIEPELQSSRWQSSWLIRRGRVRLGQGEEQTGRNDLEQAIGEIERRLNGERPDVTLLVDRACALQLLGRAELAAKDVATARASGAEPWLLERIKAAR